MFTGIITDIGTVDALEERGDLQARIRTGYDTDGIDIGASIACDGVCLTVTGLGAGWFEVGISAETVSKTAIGAHGWLDQLFEHIRREGMECAPDFITVDSAEGGTGAAPLALIDDMGLPLRESLPMLVDKLEQHGLRERVKVVASGKLITPADVAWALCIGADFVTSARGFMFALGCIQALQCNKNTCPTGITTHDKHRQRGLVPADKAVRVMHYARNMVKEVGIIAHSCGVRSPRQLQRKHARIVTANGLSVPLDELHPPVPARAHAA